MLDTSNGGGPPSAVRDEAPCADRSEAERLAALRRCAILDTPPETSFDRMTRLASAILEMPIALISLLDQDRQCFKSHHGIALRETAREGSLCAVAIRGDAVLEVPDARLDPRFADSPLVTGPPHIRFYAGAPLRTEDGHNIGALAVVDHRPRTLSAAQKAWLAELADLVVELIELRSVGLRLRREIAERERTERALRESEERVRDFAETASDWFWETDADLRFSYFSERYAHQTGESVTARLGKRRDQVALNDPGDDDWAAHLADIAARLPFRDFVYAYQDRDGVRRFAETSGKPIFDQLGRFCGYRGSARDITARKRAEEQIRHLAHHDTLTGLPNRRLFQDRLEQALALAQREGKQLSVMMLDLDYFKEVNDTLGHAIGDELLCAVATRILDAVRASDTVARVGGDEFAVIQTSLGSADGAAVLAQKVIEALARPFVLGDHEIGLGASMGIALFPEDGSDRDRLLRNADLALYGAKKEGRGCWRFFDASMQQEVLSRKSLERDLRQALRRDEFRVVYQPQLDPRTNRIVSAEALLRWRHPDRGLIPPGEFIPVAETSGLIRTLGRWILDAACREARAWADAGHPLRVAVNLSPAEMRGEDLLTTVDEILRRHGLPPGLLELEITERLFMEPSDSVIGACVQGLAGRGIRLAIDDFGTGYSSLAYLKRLPVSKIKIDRTFVQEIGRDAENEAVVLAVIALAKSPGKVVIAEGVETQSQLAFLRLHGCDEVQGFFISHPTTARQFRRLLETMGRPLAALG